MKVDTTKIEGYDAMSTEEKLAALEGYEMEIPDESTHLKELLSKKNKELGDITKQLRERMSAEEKADEGKQQNNCVGHYYDDSILDDRNLIYFLRKVANPKKSYMTCRYQINYSETIEYRLKNNESVYNDREVAILRQIDAIIKANLK